MSTSQKRQRPATTGRRCRNSIECAQANTTRLPRNWRDRLPDAAIYYRAIFAKLGKPNTDGWAACCCPFHEDKNPSASANLITGGFVCHSTCGVKHDLVGFHEHLRCLGFAAAVHELIGGRP
jgi:hypothetical protein